LGDDFSEVLGDIKPHNPPAIVSQDDHHIPTNMSMAAISAA
jgi:hypothetical protein